MDMLSLKAKSNPSETIREHTDKLLSALENLKELYGSYFDDNTLKSIWYACEYHDYGKVMYNFQKNNLKDGSCSNTLDTDTQKTLNKLYNDLGFSGTTVPHGYISPAFLPIKEMVATLDKDCISNIVSAIYYHHDRTITIDATTTREILQNDIKKRFPNVALYPRFREKIIQANNDNLNQWIDFAIIMGILNRCDYYASNTNPDKLPFEIDGSFNGKYLNDCVLDKFDNKLRDCQLYAQSHTQDNIIIVASTGIGKTEASILWANGEKMFYTLPLKVSINAMYERLSNRYDYPKDKVTLLHSNALEIITTECENFNDGVYKYDASRIFSYPVTVCTIDQLFTFVYRYHGCEQLLATLRYSKVIIDEIQSYSPDILAKLIYGLYILSQAKGKFAILTATLPPVLLYFIDKLNIPHAEPQQFLKNQIRHRIKILDGSTFDCDAILQHSKDKKVLVICNTIKNARDVYSELLESTSNVKLLHSGFIQRHRASLEKEILTMGDDEVTKTGIWVSTQLVEASLDISFDVLFTEMSTADSLLQRMGRCYRQKDYTSENPNVYILDNKNHANGKLYDMDIYERSIEFLKEFDDSYFTEQDKISYINNVYNVDQIKDTSYFKTLESNLNSIKNIQSFNYSKAEAKEHFRKIFTYNIVPSSIYDTYLEDFNRNISILNDRKSSKEDKTLARKFINDNSTTISTFDNRAKSLHPIPNLKDYYTLYNFKYDFDETSNSGLGLTSEYSNDDDFI